MTKIVLDDRAFISYSFFDSPNLPNRSHGCNYAEMLDPFREQIFFFQQKGRIEHKSIVYLKVGVVGPGRVRKEM